MEVSLTPATSTPPRPATAATAGRQLSTASKHYDRGDKGYLDDTELALRRLDSTNQGFLDVDKVYDIMHSLQAAHVKNAELLQHLHQESQQKDSFRRGLLLMCVFAALLTVSNIGTSFAAARLAKDTRVNAVGDLMSTSSGGDSSSRVGVTSKQVVFEMYPLNDDDEKRHHDRALQSSGVCSKASKTGASCALQGKIEVDQAALLYEQFCPSRNADGLCSGGGVKEVELMCNGHLSTLYGGHMLPPTPPTPFEGDLIVYPTDGTGYAASAAVYLNGMLFPCVQDFRVGMYCPTAESVAAGSEDADCMVFLWWIPACPGAVDLCGAAYQQN